MFIMFISIETPKSKKTDSKGSVKTKLKPKAAKTKTATARSKPIVKKEIELREATVEATEENIDIVKPGGDVKPKAKASKTGGKSSAKVTPGKERAVKVKSKPKETTKSEYLLCRTVRNTGIYAG